MKKLSLNFINGDFKTNFIEKIIYLFFFSLEILFEKKTKNYEKKIYIQKFLKTYKKKLFEYSPSRILMNYYLLNYIKSIKKKNIRILEIGCGDGRNLEIIKHSKKKFTYFGCDIKNRKSWLYLKKNNIFFFKTNLNYEKKFFSLKNIDFIFSTSVLEHIKYDLSLLIRLNKKFANAKHVHFVPAPISFFNYLLHGYRRYNFQMLKKIENFIDKKIKITKLGDIQSMNMFFYFLLQKNINHKLSFLFNSKIKKKLGDIKYYLKKTFSNTYSFALFYKIEF